MGSNNYHSNQRWWSYDTLWRRQFDVVVERQLHLVGCRSQMREAIRVRSFITIPSPFDYRHPLFYTIPRLILRR